MKVALTGATGFIGSHVLADLKEHGHEVTALVPDDAHAETVAARGATPVVVDLYDRAAVVSVLRAADGAIHTASPGDETSADLDSAVVDAAIEAFDGTGKPDRKSTRLNSSHSQISYAVFCLKKKKKKDSTTFKAPSAHERSEAPPSYAQT